MRRSAEKCDHICGNMRLYANFFANLCINKYSKCINKYSKFWKCHYMRENMQCAHFCKICEICCDRMIAINRYPYTTTATAAYYYYYSATMNSGVVTGMTVAPPWILGCQKIVGTFCSCPKIFVRKCKLWDWKPLFWGNLGAKIETLSSHNLLCRKFASFCPAYFFTHDAADYEDDYC